MSVSRKVERYMNHQHVRFEIITHERTRSSQETAHASHVSGHSLAKGVMLKEDDEYLLVVIPASRHVDLTSVKRRRQRDLELASERELSEVLTDCEFGAVPPVGGAFGVTTLVDTSLMGEPHVFFEAGDHRHIVHVSHRGFRKLMLGAEPGAFSN